MSKSNILQEKQVGFIHIYLLWMFSISVIFTENTLKDSIHQSPHQFLIPCQEVIVD